MSKPEMAALLENLEKILASGQENALLHYSLGSQYLKKKELDAAEKHLRRALALDAGYSAAWKMLGKTLTAAGKLSEAVASFDQGIQVAQEKGDIQAAKEMQVFRKRAEKTLQLDSEAC